MSEVGLNAERESWLDALELANERAHAIDREPRSSGTPLRSGKYLPCASQCL